MQTWCKVLIVDDEILIRQGIKHYINWEQDGFKIIGEASNGEEALTLIEKDQPQIVITDMVMPVMDGEELTKIIKRDYPKIEVIILSSFGDFDYVRSTFQHGIADYILKTQLEGPELLKTLQRVASRLPSFSLHTKKNDEAISIDRMIEKAMSGYELDQDHSIYEQVFPHPLYCLLGVDVKNRTHTETIDLLTLKKEIELALRKEFPAIIYRAVSAEQEFFSYVLNFKEDQLSMIKNFVQTIAKSIAVLNVEIGWIVTHPYSEFASLKMEYEEKLLGLINYRFYYPETVVLIYDQLPEMVQITEPFQLTRLIEAFKREKFEGAMDYLERHIAELSQQYMRDEFAFKSFLGNVIFNVTVLLGNMNYPTERLDREKYNYLTKIDQAIVASEAVAQFTLFLDETKRVIAAQMSKRVQPNIQRILDYIDEHYMEHLTLTDMANHFHFNASYLSNYFSTNNDQGFSEYVNQVRIEKSVDYLQSGAEPIAEISSLVGYSDHSYFCKVFKKLKGTSPSNYRRQYLRVQKESK